MGGNTPTADSAISASCSVAGMVAANGRNWGAGADDSSAPFVLADSSAERGSDDGGAAAKSSSVTGEERAVGAANGSAALTGAGRAPGGVGPDGRLRGGFGVANRAGGVSPPKFFAGSFVGAGAGPLGRDGARG